MGGSAPSSTWSFVPVRRCSTGFQFDIEDNKMKVGEQDLIVGTGAVATGEYLRVGGTDIVVTTGAGNLSFEIDARVVKTLPESSRFDLSVTTDLGTTAETSTQLCENRARRAVGDRHHGRPDRPAGGRVRREHRRVAPPATSPSVDLRVHPAQDRRRGGNVAPAPMNGPPRAGRVRGRSGRAGDGPECRRRPWAVGSAQHAGHPAEFRAPQLAPDVEVKEFHLRWGNDYAMIANPRDLLHYQLDPGEIKELLPLMDGTRTVKEIVVERFRESGDMELSGVADLVQTLRVGNFLTEPFVDVRAAVRRSIDTANAVRTRTREFAKTLMLSWSGAQGLVEWCYRYLLRWVFIPWVGALVLLAAAGEFLAFWSSYQDGTFSLSSGSPAVESLVLLGIRFVLPSPTSWATRWC